MGAWGSRVVAALTSAATLLLGGQAFATCAGLSFAGVIPAVGPIAAESGTVNANAGDTVTVTFTGGTGASGLVSFAGRTVAFTIPPATVSVTAAASDTTTVVITGFGGGTAGTFRATCSPAGGSGGTGSVPGSAIQLTQNSAIAIQNGNQAMIQQGLAITSGVVASLAGVTSIASCVVCDALRHQLKVLNDEIARQEKILAEARASERETLDEIERAKAEFDPMYEAKKAGVPVDEAAYRKAESRYYEVQYQHAVWGLGVSGREAQVKALKETRDKTERSLQGLEKSAAPRPSSSLPRSEWRRDEPLQSLAPQRAVRPSVTEDLFAFDQRPRPTTPTTVRVTTEDLLQMAQAPDGSNALRESLGGKWNIWAEGRLTGANDSVAVASGFGFLGNVGADYRFQPWLSAGMSLGVETFDNRIGLQASRVTTLGVSATPYIGVRFDQNLFASAFVGVTGLSYSTQPLPGVSASFGATRYFVGGTLSGQWHTGAWRLQPALAITYASEAQNGYVDSSGTAVPGQVVQYGRATAGPEVGYSIYAADGSWILEPFGFARFNLDYATNQQIFLNGLYVATRGNASGSLGGGLNLQARQGLSGHLQGSYDSIGVSGLDVWNAMLRFNWSF